MHHSGTIHEKKEGIDPSDSISWRQQAGWPCLDVKTLRSGGASLTALGLAVALLSRDEFTFTPDRLKTIYALEGSRADIVLRELVASGFLELRSGLYHIAREHRPT